ncbi:cupin domain-containing protein [Streptomyces sp. NPDC001978]|uniref:cupin domain-containing protein n=1 Tax=Streptomyces sp. NPDC001978 TaxID=3364627 RepID=UPI0036A2596F
MNRIRHRDDVPPITEPTGAQARIYTSLDPADEAKLTVAEVSIARGDSTTAHLHKITEEIYVIMRGVGRMRLNDDVREVRPGDCVVIKPGTVHEISNEHDEPLVFVATCAPRADRADFYAPDGTPLNHELTPS